MYDPLPVADREPVAQSDRIQCRLPDPALETLGDAHRGALGGDEALGHLCAPLGLRLVPIIVRPAGQGDHREARAAQVDSKVG